ncbi:hypothetical protein [Nonomuraea salmonea]
MDGDDVLGLRSRWIDLARAAPRTKKPQLSALNWGFSVVRRQGLEPRTR